MKKLLTLFLLASLTASCLVGCGSNSSEKKENSTETETEDVVKELAPETKFETIKISEENSDLQIEVVYNATMFELLSTEDGTTTFEVTEFPQALFDYYEDKGFHMPEEYETWLLEWGATTSVSCKSNMTAQELYDLWSEDGDQYYSELTKTAIDGEEVYKFSYILDEEIGEAYRVYERDGNVFIAASKANDFNEIDKLCALLFEDIKIAE